MTNEQQRIIIDGLRGLEFAQKLATRVHDEDRKDHDAQHAQIVALLNAIREQGLYGLISRMPPWAILALVALLLLSFAGLLPLAPSILGAVAHAPITAP